MRTLLENLSVYHIIASPAYIPDMSACIPSSAEPLSLPIQLCVCTALYPSSHIKHHPACATSSDSHVLLFLFTVLTESKQRSQSDSAPHVPALKVFSSVISQGITTLAYLPLSSFIETFGPTAEQDLLSAVRQRQQQSLLGAGPTHASMKPRKSIFSMPDRLELTRKVRCASSYSLFCSALCIALLLSWRANLPHTS